MASSHIAVKAAPVHNRRKNTTRTGARAAIRGEFNGAFTSRIRFEARRRRTS